MRVYMPGDARFALAINRKVMQNQQHKNLGWVDNRTPAYLDNRKNSLYARRELRCHHFPFKNSNLRSMLESSRYLNAHARYTNVRHTRRDRYMDRPITIKIVCIVMAALFLNGLFNLVTNPSPILDAPLMTMVFSLLGIFSNAILAGLIWMRQKWARTLFLVLLILTALPTAALSILALEEMQNASIALLSGILGQICLAILLYLSPSNRWFTSSEAIANA